MTQITKTSLVAASSEQVWDLLAAFDAISSWAKNVDHSSLLTTLNGGVGAARRVQVGRLALIESVTVWETMNELAYSIQGLPPVVKSVTNQWRMTSRGADTEVSLTTLIDPGGAPRGKIAAAVLGAVLGRASLQMLKGMQASVNKGSVPSAGVLSGAIPQAMVAPKL
ncbi:MAG: SRPBCC family protein [Microthrixaceae bacterium]